MITPNPDLEWFFGGGAAADTGYVSATGPQIEALRSGGGSRTTSSDSLAAELVAGWVSPPTPSWRQVQAASRLRRVYQAVCQLEGVHQAVLQLAYAPRSYTTPDRRGQAVGALSFDERLGAPNGHRDHKPRGDVAFSRLYADGRTIEARFGLAAGPVLVAMKRASAAIEVARWEVKQAQKGADDWERAEVDGTYSESLEYHAPHRLQAAKAALVAAEKAAAQAPERAVRLLREAHVAYDQVGRQRKVRREEERKERAMAWWESMKRRAEARQG